MLRGNMKPIIQTISSTLIPFMSVWIGHTMISMIIIVTGFSVLCEVHARGYHDNHCCLVVCSLWCICCYATPIMTAIVMGFCVMLLAKKVFIIGTKCVQSELWTVAEGSWVLRIQQLDGGTVLHEANAWLGVRICTCKLVLREDT